MATNAAAASRPRTASWTKRATPPREFARAARRPLALGVVAFVTLLPLVPSFFRGANLQSHFGAVAALIILTFACRRDRDLCARPFALGENGLGIALLVGAATTSAALARFAPGTGFGMLPVLVLVATFVAVRVALRTGRDHELLANGLSMTLIAIAAFGIVGYVEFQDALRAGAVDESQRSGWLSTPFYPHSYIAAQAALPIVPFALAFLLGRRAIRTRILAGIALLCGGAFLVLTLSRAAWLASGISCFLVIASALRSAPESRSDAARAARPRRAAPLLFAAAAIAVAAYLASPTPDWAKRIGDGARDRIVGLLDAGEATLHYSRLQVWSDSLRLASENQPFGVGPGRFAAEFGRVDEGRRFIPHAHDQYLHTLVETGTPGLVGLCLALFGSIALARRALAGSPRPPRDPTSLRGAYGGLVAIAVVGIFESPLIHAPCAMLLGAFAAIAIQGALRAQAPPAIPTPFSGPALARAGRWTRIGAAALASLLTVQTIVHVAGASLGHRARRLHEAGDSRAAAELSTRALALQPAIDGLWWLDAQIRRALGDAAGAERSLHRHAALAPRLPIASLRRAEDLSRLHRHEEALALLLDARVRAPPELVLDVEYHLANTLTWLGRDEEARVLYLGLLRISAESRFEELIDRFVKCLTRLDRERETVRVLEAR